MVARIIGRLGEFVDHTLSRGIGGIPHAHVDHVIACTTFLVGELIDPRKKIGRQLRDAIGYLNFKRLLNIERLIDGVSRIHGSGMGCGGIGLSQIRRLRHERCP